MSDNAAATPQPPPLTGVGEVVLFGVMEDLVARGRYGYSKYSTFLRTSNGRDALVDAYQEALDLAMYLKQAIIETEARPQPMADTRQTDRGLWLYLRELRSAKGHMFDKGEISLLNYWINIYEPAGEEG